MSMYINLNAVRQLKQDCLKSQHSWIFVYLTGRFSVLHIEDFPPVRYKIFLYNI